MNCSRFSAFYLDFKSYLHLVQKLIIVCTHLNIALIRDR